MGFMCIVSDRKLTIESKIFGSLVKSNRRDNLILSKTASVRLQLPPPSTVLAQEEKFFIF